MAAPSAFQQGRNYRREWTWQKLDRRLISQDKHVACHAEGRGLEPRRPAVSRPRFVSRAGVRGGAKITFWLQRDLNARTLV